MATDDDVIEQARSAAPANRRPTGSTTARALVVTLVALLVTLVSGCAFFKDPGPLPPGGFLAEIQNRGEMRVGVAIAAPMTKILPDGTYGGPNLIPLQNLADELGVPLKTIPTTWGSVVPGLLAGQFDFAANLDKTERRSRAIDFTDPVYNYQGVFVIKANALQNTSADVLSSGLPITTVQGSAPESALHDVGSNLDVVPFDTSANAIQAVLADRAIAQFFDLPTAESQVQQSNSLKIIVPDPPIFDAKSAYGIVKQADQASRDRVNSAIAAAKADGSLTEALAEVGYFEIDQLGSMQKGS